MTDEIPLDDTDRWLLNEGRHLRLGEVLGAHVDAGATNFRVWAPSARSVSLIGGPNNWTGGEDELHPDGSGVWHGRTDRFGVGDRYKYQIVGADGVVHEKADPVAWATEEPPRTASVVWAGSDASNYAWGDSDWLKSRTAVNSLGSAMSIYELHLGSWRYEPGGYRALAQSVGDHVERCGFTHVELLPITEHPFYGSWGYQTTGYFAPTARYGQPEDLMFMIDHLHQRGIGVIFDWVPSHFPTDAFGLARFDGSHLYEHADPRLGHHPDWDSAIFNYERHEVRSFLLSSAFHWLGFYHGDGIRVDAVASMLYRDYSRSAGEWIPNEFGGRENLGAVEFLRDLNSLMYREFPDIVMVAEESTAWPGVSRPVDAGGLGFGLKWDMGWMHDTLLYIERDPIHRRHHHDELTFRSAYGNSENFVLPLSHDEVVHGKGSLLSKQPGDEWQRFAGLRLLFGIQWTAGGVPLLFMGGEFASPVEWNHEAELPWGLSSQGRHAQMTDWVRHLNDVRAAWPALHVGDHDDAGFQWVVGDDNTNSVFAHFRMAEGESTVLVVFNATPVVREGYRIGVPVSGRWTEIANSDDLSFGGSGVGNTGLHTEDTAAHGFEQSLNLRIPPLGIVMIAPAEPGGD